MLLQMFLAGEIAQELFEENPTAFLQVTVLYTQLHACRVAHTSCNCHRSCCLSRVCPLPQELRQGRYVKANSQNRELLYTISRLGLPVETRASPGVALLPPETVEQLLADRRKVPIKTSCLEPICWLSSGSASTCCYWQYALVACRAPLKTKFILWPRTGWCMLVPGTCGVA